MRKRIQFSIPTNWQDDLIERVAKKDVAQLFGKLNSDFTGGGRLSVAVPFVCRKKVVSHIAQMHKCGLEFSYVINGSCLDNLEWTRRGQREIRKLLSWLVEIGADSVTVAIPYLAELIKKFYPELRIEVSSFAEVDTVCRAKRWEDLGVDVITLASHKINRDFDLLKAIRENITCGLQLIANNCCLDGCIHHTYHANLSTHASQKSNNSKYLVLDKCRLLCDFLRLRNTEKIISSGWIRPEDVAIYEEIGVDRIKLVDRQMTTEAICNIVKAYTNRHYLGNFYELLPGPSKNINYKGLNIFKKIPFLIRNINLLPVLFKIKKLVKPERIFIDNQALDGFLNFFLEGRCTGLCKECGYCRKISEKAIRISPVYYKYFMDIYEKELKDIVSQPM